MAIIDDTLQGMINNGAKIGDVDKLKLKLTIPEKRKAFYDKVSGMGLTDAATFEDFEKSLGYGAVEGRDPNGARSTAHRADERAQIKGNGLSAEQQDLTPEQIARIDEAWQQNKDNSKMIEFAKAARDKRRNLNIYESDDDGTDEALSIADYRQGMANYEKYHAEVSEAADTAETIMRQLDEQIKEEGRQERDVEQRKAAGRTQTIEDYLPSFGAGNVSAGQQARIMRMGVTYDPVMRAREIMSEALTILRSPNREQGGGFLQGAKEIFTDPDTWTLGALGTAQGEHDYNVIKNIQDKINNNQELTEDEETLYNSLVFKAAAEAMRDGDITTGYSAGKIASSSLAFMAEFLLTGGLAKAASSGVRKVATSAFKKYLERLVRKGLQTKATKQLIRKGVREGLATRAAGKIAENRASNVAGKLANNKIARIADSRLGGAVSGMTIESAARMPLMPSTWKTIYDDMTPTVMPDGKVEDGMPFWKAAADAYIEVMSESSGELFGIAKSKTAGKLFNFFGQKLNKYDSKISDYIKLASGVVNKGNAMLKKGGFHGLLEETGEEIIGETCKYLMDIDSDEGWNKFWSKDNFTEMLLGFAPMSVFGLAHNGVQAGRVYSSYNTARQGCFDALQRMGNMSEEEAQQTMSDIDNATPENFEVTVNRLFDRAGQQSHELGAQIVNYMMRKAQKDALQVAWTQDEDVSETATERINQQYKDLSTQLAKNANRRGMIAALSNNDANLTDAVERFIADHEGLTAERLYEIVADQDNTEPAADALRNEYADMIAQATIDNQVSDAVYSRSNASNGRYVEAVLSNGKTVNIIEGDHLSDDPNTSIRYMSADGTIADGTVGMIERIVADEDAQQVADAERQRLKQSYDFVKNNGTGTYLTMTIADGESTGDVFRVIGYDNATDTIQLEGADGNAVSMPIAQAIANFKPTFNVGDTIISDENGTLVITSIDAGGIVGLTNYDPEGNAGVEVHKPMQHIMELRNALEQQGLEVPPLQSETARQTVREQFSDAEQQDAEQQEAEAEEAEQIREQQESEQEEPAYPTTAEGEPDWDNMDEQTIANVIVDELGSREEGTAFVASMIAQAEKDRKDAEKMKVNSTSLRERKAQIEMRGNAIATAEANTAKWNAVKQLIENANTENAEAEEDKEPEQKRDKQGNELNEDGTLKVDKINSIDELTDEDFINPTRSVELPKLPDNVDNAIGANGKPVVIKKNIFEKNRKDHADVTPSQSRDILTAALYSPNLYGQNQKTTRPYNWVVINTKDESGKNRIVLLEVNHNKDNVEIIHWHYVRNSALETIKKQAEREGGQILILPSENSEEVGGLSDLTSEPVSSEETSDTRYTDEQKKGSEKEEKNSEKAEEKKETKEEREQRRLEERKQRILQEGTTFDEYFGLVKVSEDMSAADIVANIQKIISTLKEKGDKVGDFKGFAGGGKWAWNAGKQIEHYWQALQGVAPEETLREAANQLGVKTPADLVAYGEKMYKAEEQKPTEQTNVVAEHRAKQREEILKKFEPFKNFVTVYTSIDEIESEQAKEHIRKGHTVHAWYDVNAKRVCVYLPHIRDAEEAEEKMWHEVVGHMGLRQLAQQIAPKDKQAADHLFDAIWNGMSKKQREWGVDYIRMSLPSLYDRCRQRAETLLKMQGKEINKANLAEEIAADKEMQRAAADEFAAHLAERLVGNDKLTIYDRNVLKKLVDTIRQWLAQLIGVQNLKLDAHDVCRLLIQSRENIVKNTENTVHSETPERQKEMNAQFDALQTAKEKEKLIADWERQGVYVTEYAYIGLEEQRAKEFAEGRTIEDIDAEIDKAVKEHDEDEEQAKKAWNTMPREERRASQKKRTALYLYINALRHEKDEKQKEQWRAADEAESTEGKQETNDLQKRFNVKALLKAKGQKDEWGDPVYDALYFGAHIEPANKKGRYNLYLREKYHNGERYNPYWVSEHKDITEAEANKLLADMVKRYTPVAVEGESETEAENPKAKAEQTAAEKYLDHPDPSVVSDRALMMQINPQLPKMNEAVEKAQDKLNAVLRKWRPLIEAESDQEKKRDLYNQRNAEADPLENKRYKLWRELEEAERAVRRTREYEDARARQWREEESREFEQWKKDLQTEPAEDKAKFNADDYASRNELHGVMQGMYHDADAKMGVVTDAHILVAAKQLYDSKQKGKVIATHNIKADKNENYAGTKKGEAIKGKQRYPNWRSALVSESRHTTRQTVDFGDMANRVAGVIEQQRAAWQAEKEKGERVGTFSDYIYDKYVAMRLPDGNVKYFKISQLRKFLTAAKLIGGEELVYSSLEDSNTRPISALSKDGEVVVEGSKRPDNPQDIAGVIDLAEGGERFSVAKKNQTPRNTSLDDVLFSIRVNHNTPYLLKKADGSFVDPETGERLGFDHRFMGTGEGAQVHGWGSYFSVNDIRGYANNNSINIHDLFNIDFDVIKDYILTSAAKDIAGDVINYAARSSSYVNKQLVEQIIGDAIGYSHTMLESAKKDIADAERQGLEALAKITKKHLQYYQNKLEALQQLKSSIKDNLQDVLSHHHYVVDIPDNNGTNYLEEMRTIPKSQRRKIADKVRALEGEPKQSVKYVTYKGGWEQLANMIEREQWAYLEIRDRLVQAFGGKLGDEERLSNLMHDAGFVGIHYDGRRDGECYVIFDENDAQIVAHERFSVTPAEDAAYMDAVERGDMETAQRMVNEAAAKAGYDSNTDYQGSVAFNGAAPSANGYFETKEERKEAFDNGELEGEQSLGDYIDNGIDRWDLDWQLKNPIAASGRDQATLASIRNLNYAIRNGNGKIKMYRAVDADIKENSFRNGDWVTPSRQYATEHIGLQNWKRGRIIEQEVSVDDIWWDGNDINEWGYDDGKGYAYKNTKNNRKLLDAVTYDDEGKVIPLSKRFNSRKDDVRFSVSANTPTTPEDDEEYVEPELPIYDPKTMSILDYLDVLKAYNAERLKIEPDKQAELTRREMRNALLKQKREIKDTVAILTKIANTMLADRGLGDVNKGAVQRTLAAIKNAATKRDLEEYMNTLYDIAIKRQISQVKARFKKILSLPTKKVNQNRVSVARSVDDKTRVIMQTFKQWHNEKDEDIRRRMDENSDKLSDPTTTDLVRETLDAENLALGICLAYQDEVKAQNDLLRDLRAEEKELEDSNIDAADKAAQLATIAKQRREAQSALVDAYERVNNVLGDIYLTGHDELLDQLERIQQHKKEVLSYAWKDLESVVPDVNAKKQNGLQRTADWFLNPNRTFLTELKKWGRFAPNGEGYLYNYFARKFVDARHTQINGTNDAINELNEACARILGKKYNTFVKALKATKKVVAQAEFTIGENEGTIPLNIGQIMLVYAWNKQTDGRAKLEKMGIDNAEVEKWIALVPKEYIDLMDWIQEKFLPKLRDKYNKTHLAVFGTQMAMIPDYFPLKIANEAIARKEEVEAQEFDKFVSGTVGAIKNRTHNKNTLDIMNNDALSVLAEHVKEMEWFNAMTSLAQDVNTLVGSRTFNNKINALSWFDKGSSRRLSRELGKILLGRYSEDSQGEQLASSLIKMVARSKIAYRLWTAIKQFASWPAFFADRDAVKHLHETFIHPIDTMRWCFRNLPILKERWESRLAGNAQLDTAALDKWKIGQFFNAFSQMGLLPNGAVDAFTCCLGAKAKYEGARRRYLRYGLPESEAEHRALQDAEIFYNETQQSSEGLFRSQMQASRTVYNVAMSAFQNAQFGYGRKFVDGLRQIYRATKRRNEMQNYTAEQWKLLGVEDEKAKQIAQKEWRDSLIQGIVNVAVFGYAIQALWYVFGHAPQLVYSLFAGGDDDDEEKVYKAKAKDILLTDLAQAASTPIIGFRLGAQGDAFLQSVLNEREFDLNSANKDLFVSDFVNMVRNVGKGIDEQDYSMICNAIASMASSTATGVDINTLYQIFEPIAELIVDENISPKEIYLDIMRIFNMPNSQQKAVGLEYIPKQTDGADWVKRYIEWKRKQKYGVFFHLFDRPTDARQGETIEQKQSIEKEIKQAKTEAKRLATENAKILNDIE